MLALLALATGGAAWAEPPRVAVLPFDGPGAARVHAEIVRALQKAAELPPEAVVAAAAKQVPARGAPDLAKVAHDLAARAVIAGAVRREKTWLLAIEVRDADGNALRLLEYPLAGNRVDPATLKRATDEVSAAIAALTQAPPPEIVEPEPAPPAPPPPPPPVGEPRIPYLDGAVALLLGGRNFGFGKNAALDGLATCQPGASTCPTYRGAIAAGLHVDATGFPLRLLPKAWGARKYLVGLGAGISYDYVGWPGSEDKSPGPATCPGGATSCRFRTREQRIEAGLRYRWRFLDRSYAPFLLGALEYGYHSFSIDPAADGSTIVPSVLYQYVDIGAGLLVPFLERFSIQAMLHGRPSVAAGPIQTAKEFGPGRGGGLRAEFGADAKVWRDLAVRATGFYELVWLSFTGAGMPAKTTDGKASDAYWGVTLGAAYSY